MKTARVPTTPQQQRRPAARSSLVLCVALCAAGLGGHGCQGAVGGTQAFFSPGCPTGFVPLFGQELSVAEYPDLHEHLGERYGGSNGTFRVPDTRGLFLRAVDADGNTDPEAAVRTPRPDGASGPHEPGTGQRASTALPNSGLRTSSGGNHVHSTSSSGSHVHQQASSGAAVHGYSNNRPTANSVMSVSASYQGGAAWTSTYTFAERAGGIPDVYSTSPSGSHTHLVRAAGAHAHGVVGGDPETRPSNVAVVYCMQAVPQFEGSSGMEAAWQWLQRRVSELETGLIASSSPASQGSDSDTAAFVAALAVAIAALLLAGLAVYKARSFARSVSRDLSELRAALAKKTAAPSPQVRLIDDASLKQAAAAGYPQSQQQPGNRPGVVHPDDGVYFEVTNPSGNNAHVMASAQENPTYVDISTAGVVSPASPV